jgi:nicotinamide-nucleotide adenylyltransferase
MIILYIGRFQPFHNGHLELIKSIYNKFDKIIIGIGSSQYSHALNNPFTLEERKSMIINTLKENKIQNFIIFEIPDIHNYPKWVSHVESIIPKFDIVLTNNSITASLFKKRGYKIYKSKLFNKKEFSGEEIRKKILKSDKSWKNSIPKSVYDIIIEIDGVKRIKNI